MPLHRFPSLQSLSFKHGTQEPNPSQNPSEHSIPSAAEEQEEAPASEVEHSSQAEHSAASSLSLYVPASHFSHVLSQPDPDTLYPGLQVIVVAVQIAPIGQIRFEQVGVGSSGSSSSDSPSSGSSPSDSPSSGSSESGVGVTTKVPTEAPSLAK